MNTGQSLLFFGIVALITVFTRAAAFLLFPEGRRTPRFVTYLGKVLPYTMIGLLVVYCLKDVAWLSGTHGAPELISIALTAGLHVWRRNTLVSIAAGTVCYMLLVQFVFV